MQGFMKSVWLLSKVFFRFTKRLIKEIHKKNYNKNNLTIYKLIVIIAIYLVTLWKYIKNAWNFIIIIILSECLNWQQY